MAVRVGIDLARPDDVEQALAAHGERYLERVFTAREVGDCTTEHGVDAQRLAARFAAKEAAMKVLRPDGDAVPWPDVEVVRAAGGWVELELHGAAAALAARAGIADLAVSLTHEDGLASAVVVAELSGGASSTTREGR
jgi:holo-[acyl-carrier protein] synthase